MVCLLDLMLLTKCHILQPTTKLLPNSNLNHAQEFFQCHRSLFNSSSTCLHPLQCCLSSTSFTSLNVPRIQDLPNVQTLSDFPEEELLHKLVLVRFDYLVLLHEDATLLPVNAIHTVHYLLSCGARVLLVGDWGRKNGMEFQSQESVAESLSRILQRRVAVMKRFDHGTMPEEKGDENSNLFLLDNLAEFKEEIANCQKFAKQLAAGVDIFVNDSFSLSHKILSSTVGVSRFCYARMAGFHLEDSLRLMKKAADFTRKPSVAIVGGTNLTDKESAIHFLCSKCDIVVFVGMISFQIMNRMRIQVAPNLIKLTACKSASKIVHHAQLENLTLVYPIDLWCLENGNLKLVEIEKISNRMIPVDLGPSSLKKIESLLENSQKVIWIGSMKFMAPSNLDLGGSTKLADILHCQSSRGCDVFVVGAEPCQAMKKSNHSSPSIRLINSSVFWEFLRGQKLHGVVALDRSYPLKINWFEVFDDPKNPLTVDIGSGNGMFVLQMATKTPKGNFLGLEINKKLVNRCLDSVHQSKMKNVHFICANATSTFRSIVSSYHGSLILVSIQCPNPDFVNPESRWRMLQRSLVEGIADLLVRGGKVFLQSDVEEVVLRMKQVFFQYGKEIFVAQNPNCGTWLEENPFEAPSDWEKHVLQQGHDMYRLILEKK